MARARKVQPSGLVRSLVRNLVRTGNYSRADIAVAVAADHPNVLAKPLTKMIVEEERRQQKVDAIMNRNKSRNVADVRRLVKCPPGTTVRASIVLEFTDQNTGQYVRFNGVVDLANTGRLANILNQAIQTVIDSAIAHKYAPPQITSANRTPGGRYRLDYVECAQ